MNTRETIAAFLQKQGSHNLMSRWSMGMETQVNVHKVDGDPTGRPGEFSDGIDTWKHFRIPWNAKSSPEYEDRPLRWDITKYAYRIGSTGWDWEAKRSRWVGFDFDSVLDHADNALTQEQLDEIHTAVQDVPFVEVYRSTRGNGFHIYVFVDEPTDNHTEHSALAKAVLSQISEHLGIDLKGKVDCYGGNMWIWAADAADNGYELLSEATETLTELPPNWKDQAPTIRHTPIEEKNDGDAIFAAHFKHKLSDEHKVQIESIRAAGYGAWWDSDRSCLRTHVGGFKSISEGIIGPYETNSPCNNPQQPNCFAFPLPKAGWKIFLQGGARTEASTWTHAANSTWCYFNRATTLDIACRTAVKAGDTYKFPSSKAFVTAMAEMGVEVTDPEVNSEVTVKLESNAITSASIDVALGSAIDGWSQSGGKTIWQDGNGNIVPERSFKLVEDLVRSCKHEDNTVAGWRIRGADGDWEHATDATVKRVLRAKGYTATDADQLMGNQELKRWTLTSQPFKPEYLGDRQWNVGAASFAMEPSPAGKDTKHPTWDLVLNHLGDKLTEYIQIDEAFDGIDIYTGGDYLRAWVASSIQRPYVHTPYLFFYGRQNSGKSVFHEALDVIFNNAVQQADRAITSPTHNGELEHAVFTVVEETNIAASNRAKDRIKDYTTGKILAIRKMQTDVIQIPNKTHWIQCANAISYCPVDADDSRITFINVAKPDQIIPKEQLLTRLRMEGPDFLRTLLDFRLPEAVGRLALPVVESEAKRQLKGIVSGPVAQLMDFEVITCPGKKLALETLYARFRTKAGHASAQWNKAKFQTELLDLGYSVDARSVYDVSFYDKCKTKEN